MLSLASRIHNFDHECYIGSARSRNHWRQRTEYNRPTIDYDYPLFYPILDSGYCIGYYQNARSGVAILVEGVSMLLLLLLILL